MADLLFFNGRFYDHASGFSEPQAMLVREGKIYARGDLNALELLVSENAERIDARGSYILPGFNDAHIHVWKVGNLLTYLIDVRGIESLDALGSRLQQAARVLDDVNAWIMVRGFNEALWEKADLPTCQDLDRFVSDQPVYLLRTCAHIAVLNSTALKACGLEVTTLVPAGGEIRRSADGSLSGVITESALGLISPYIPEYSAAQYEKMIFAAQELLFRNGITSATDPAVHPQLMQVYQNLNNSGRLRLRINAMPILLPDGASKPNELPALTDSPFLKVQTAKLFADGGLSSQTAAVKRPYLKRSAAEVENRGVLRIIPDRLKELVFAACRQGYTLAIHAIGDLAIEKVLDVYELAAHEFPSAKANRIEHFELPEPADLDRMAALGCMAIMQPVFIHELGLNFRQSLDNEYLGHLLPVKTLLDRNIITAFSTDAPVVSSLNPFQNITTAITRKDSSGFVFGAPEAVTIIQALEAYTLGSAKAEFSDHEKGCLLPGMYADMIFLDQHPLLIAPAELINIHVTATYIGGNCVYSSIN